MNSMIVPLIMQHQDLMASKLISKSSVACFPAYAYFNKSDDKILITVVDVTLNDTRTRTRTQEFITLSRQISLRIGMRARARARA